MSTRKIRVLVVDDSAIARKVISDGLARDPAFEVVGTASDAYIARDKIVQLKPDVMTLDIDMPRLDGIGFLRKLLPQYPIAVVMCSSLAQKGEGLALEALEAGAIDFVHKPRSDDPNGAAGMIAELSIKLKVAANANLSRVSTPPQKTAQPVVTPSLGGSDARDKAMLPGLYTGKMIAIGASTGGTEALRAILPKFPITTPGIVIVQHMPAGFTTMFAQRLNEICPMEVKEAATGDRVYDGRVLIAPGNMQLRVQKGGLGPEVVCSQEEPVNGHKPSVSVMMHSVAKVIGSSAVGVMMTGMGGDGADGLLAMRTAKARTLAQDEATCVVYGMPQVAYKKGGVEQLVPLDSIPEKVLDLLTHLHT